MKLSNEPAVYIEIVRTGILLAVLFGAQVTPEQLGGIIVFLGAVALAITRGAVTPNAKVNTVTTTTLKAIAVLGISLFLLASPASVKAETPSLLSLDRLSAGPRVVAQVYDFDSDTPREVGFVAGAAASWNLTSLWDVDASLERKFNAGEAVPAHWRKSAGLHVLLPNSSETQQWFLAVERAWYDGGGLPESGQWVVRLQWAFGAQDKSGHDYGFAIVRGRYDVPDAEHDGRRDFGFGIQPQLIGGK